MSTSKDDVKTFLKVKLWWVCNRKRLRRKYGRVIMEIDPVTNRVCKTHSLMFSKFEQPGPLRVYISTESSSSWTVLFTTRGEVQL